MVVKVDTSINEKTVAILKESQEALNTGVKSNLSSDFNFLTNLGLCSAPIDNLKKAVDSLATYHESFISVVEENKYQWNEVASQVQNQVQALDTNGTTTAATTTTSSGSRYSSGTSSGRSGSSGGMVYSGDGGGDGGASDVKKGDKKVSSGKKVSTEDILSIISKLDSTTTPILLKKIKDEDSGDSLIDLLTESSKGEALLLTLKKILGDKEPTIEEGDDASQVQQQLLEKVNVDEVDITTEEGKTQLEEVILTDISQVQSEEPLNELIYGDNTVSINLLDGDWVVAKTNANLEEYLSHISSNGVCQDSDTSKYSDYCLAFSYVHAYDLYNNSRGSAEDAGNYAHAGAFEDFIDDDKQTVLKKVYEEIMNGRPVVIQVNGNKAGTSRHFVTVVGFKKGVTADNITEQDLLIIDSWDGKLERMDTETSRFMTSGADCGKEYSGYRLRVLKA